MWLLRPEYNLEMNYCIGGGVSAYVSSVPSLAGATVQKQCVITRHYVWLHRHAMSDARVIDAR